MSIATELQRIQTAITSAFTAVSSKGGTVPTSKTVSNLKTAIDSIPSGLDTSDATATASDILSGKTAYSKGSKITGSMSSVTAATPSISVSSSGLITASTSQSAGYVSAANKSATKQLTTQAAQTITPGTSNKTIASGRYLTGTQTIQGDSNLVAGNIKKGVSIFGVAGGLAEGFGGVKASELHRVRIKCNKTTPGDGTTGILTVTPFYIPYQKVLSATNGGAVFRTTIYDSSKNATWSDYDTQDFAGAMFLKVLISKGKTLSATIDSDGALFLITDYLASTDKYHSYYYMITSYGSTRAYVTLSIS